MNLVRRVVPHGHFWGHVLLVSAVTLAAACYFHAVLFAQSMAPIVSLLSDDAFYYFKIARNIVQGQGCTFDGIAPTNGFHPLWMLCVLPAHWLAGQDLEAPVRIVLIGSGLLCIGTLILLYRVVDKYAAPGVGSVAVAACLLPNVLSAMTNGMETGLLLFVVIVLLWFCYKRGFHKPESGARASLAFGVLLGLAALCRLDAVFLFAAAACLTVTATVILEFPLARCVRRLLLLTAGFGFTTAPYVIWNLSCFGHIMPISGRVKSSFPLLRDTLSLRGDLVFGAALLAALIALTMVAAIAHPSRQGLLRSTICSPLSMLTLACAFHFVHALLFLSWGVYWWHFALYGVSIAIALAQVVSRLTLSIQDWRPAVVTGIIVPILVLAAAMKVRELGIKGKQHEGWLKAAEWARTHTAVDAVFAIKDAGLFGYFSDRRVINLDGKANGYEYLEYLRSNKLASYLRAVNVRYMASISARYRGGKCGIAIPMVNHRPAIILMDKGAEVYRSTLIPAHPVRFGTPPESHFVIWEIP